jgi:hypothetical protein
MRVLYPAQHSFRKDLGTPHLLNIQMARLAAQPTPTIPTLARRATSYHEYATRLLRFSSLILAFSQRRSLSHGPQ